MNKTILLGRLANDPEIKYHQNGMAISKFTLAVPRDNDREKADFFFCTAFGKLAQTVSDYCSKGRQVLLDGRIELNNVNDKTYVNIIANSIEFLAKPQLQQQSPMQQPTPVQQQSSMQQFYPIQQQPTMPQQEGNNTERYNNVMNAFYNHHQ